MEENVNGLLFPPGDSNALAERLIRYFKSNLGAALAANLRARGGETAGSNLADVLEEMLS